MTDFTEYAGNSANYPATVSLPNDGTLLNGVAHNTALEQLADRTAFAAVGGLMSVTTVGFYNFSTNPAAWINVTGASATLSASSSDEVLFSLMLLVYATTPTEASAQPYARILYDNNVVPVQMVGPVNAGVTTCCGFGRAVGRGTAKIAKVQLYGPGGENTIYIADVTAPCSSLMRVEVYRGVA